MPSAEIAIVRNGKLVLNKAFGKANEGLTARPDLPYQIASNSKQFTAMALILLRDDGKLSLDDHVSKFVQGITGGDEIPSVSCSRTRRVCRTSGRRTTCSPT